MSKTTVILLFLVTLIGFIIRIYKLDSVPTGFFCDEAAIGYNAYKILTSGADEYGKPFPFFFRSFGDYRLPVPIYSNIPIIALFGLNEFSVRLTAVFFGTLTIGSVFFLSTYLFKSKLIGLLSSLFLAFSPWHIHYSRFGSEYIYFPFWLSLGFFIFLWGIKSKNKIILPISFFVLGISLYTYYPSLFIVPLFVFFICLIYINNLMTKKVTFFVGLFIFIIALMPFLIGIRNDTVLTRWKSVSAIDHKTSFTQAINTYYSHFSSDFLFAKGDIDYPGHFITRFSVKGFGQLYWMQLPLLILGIIWLIKYKLKKPILVLILWFLLYPLGSTVTGTDGGGPFAFRSIIGVIPFQILSAIGSAFVIELISDKTKKILAGTVIVFALTIFSSSYLYSYYTKYSYYSSDFWGWQFGPKQVMDYFKMNHKSYDELILMGNFNAPQIFIPFYDPHDECKGKCKIGGLEVFNINKKQLYAIGSDRIKEISKNNFSIKKIINYPNTNPAFLIGTINP